MGGLLGREIKKLKSAVLVNDSVSYLCPFLFDRLFHDIFPYSFPSGRYCPDISYLIYYILTGTVITYYSILFPWHVLS